MAFAIAVGEHPLEVTEREEITKLLQTYLFLVVEVGISMMLARRSIGRIKEEECVPASLAIGFLVISVGDGYALQQFAVGEYGVPFRQALRERERSPRDSTRMYRV